MSTTFDSTNKIIKSEHDSIIVIKDTVIKNETVYIIQSIINGIPSFSIYALNRADGFYVVDIRKDSVKHTDSILYFLYYKYPGNIGDIFLNGTDTLKILSVSSVISAMNTNYTCYAYFNEKQYPNIYYKQNLYLSPGIGPIYNEQFSQATGGILYMYSKTETLSYLVK
jgi:hypothetical protein